MNHKHNLANLIVQWLELDLPKTCVSLDLYTSMEIRKHPGDIISFTKKCRGSILQVARAQVSDDRKTVGWDTDPILLTPDMGLVLYALEKAIETN